MKKVAIVTVAVLALGLAACNKSNADNNAANETAVENTSSTDVNAARQRIGDAMLPTLRSTRPTCNASGNSADNTTANATTNQ